MGFDLVHGGSMCVLLFAKAESGAFFQNLAVYEKHGQRMFHLGSKVVKFFPEHLMVTLEVFLDRCSPGGEIAERFAPRRRFRGLASIKDLLEAWIRDASGGRHN
jgi:hypothetical protein